MALHREIAREYLFLFCNVDYKLAHKCRRGTCGEKYVFSSTGMREMSSCVHKRTWI